MQTFATAKIQQPSGDPATLRFSAGAVFGVFRVGRGRYRVAMLRPGHGWQDCELGEPDFDRAGAIEALHQNCDIWCWLQVQASVGA